MRQKVVDFKKFCELLNKPAPRLTLGVSFFLALIVSTLIFGVSIMWACIIAYSSHPFAIGLFSFLASVVIFTIEMR